MWNWNVFTAFVIFNSSTAHIACGAPQGTELDPFISIFSDFLQYKIHFHFNAIKKALLLNGVNIFLNK